MYRTWIILLHTLREAIAQPIYALLLAAGAVILGVYATLPFFTLGEDTLMFKAVGLDVVLIIVLLISLFAASRSVHEEIEDRTMLTLMSKPVGRGQVLMGKFLGLLISAALAVAALGIVLAVCVWLRIPRDFTLPSDPVQEAVAERLYNLRAMHLAGLWPQLVLVWMQIGVLIAIGVAISTRFSLVVNLPAALLLYIAGNLTRFIEGAADGGSWFAQAVAFAINTLLPFLAVFDLTDATVYGVIALPGTEFVEDPNARTIGYLWTYVAAASTYFAAYVAFVLCIAVLSFRTRELGGNEG